MERPEISGEGSGSFGEHSEPGAETLDAARELPGLRVENPGSDVTGSGGGSALGELHGLLPGQDGAASDTSSDDPAGDGAATNRLTSQPAGKGPSPSRARRILRGRGHPLLGNVSPLGDGAIPCAGATYSSGTGRFPVGMGAFPVGERLPNEKGGHFLTLRVATRGDEAFPDGYAICWKERSPPDRGTSTSMRAEGVG